MNRNFIVLPQWALWDHSERKKTIQQKSISSPHPTHRKLLQLRCTSKICKLEKLFADEISTYTFITAGIFSQYFFLYKKIRQLKSGNSDVIIWKVPSVKIVFDSAKVARPSSDRLIEPATNFSSPIFRTDPPWTQILHQTLPLWYWTRCGQVCFNSIHLLPRRL